MCNSQIVARGWKDGAVGMDDDVSWVKLECELD